MRSFPAISGAVVISLLLLCVHTGIAVTNKTSHAKLFRLEFQIEPVQPIVGNNTVILTVYDARSNEKIDDAAIEAIPWMTMHGHGSSKKTSVKKEGSGKYLIENVYFTMEGDWDLMVTIQKKEAKDTATFPVSNVKKK